jgi:hypothetical protein
MAQGSLGDLVLALSADTATFQSDLGKANREAEKFGKDVGKAIGGIVGALAALGGSAGLIALVKGQIDAADAAGKMAQKVGTSVEALSAYMVAAKLSDVSNQQLQTGFQQLSKNQAEFVQGTGKAKEAFDALGITTQQVKDANGDTAKIFELVAGKLSKFEDGANKTALAMAIFGRSGAELIPLINSLDETRDKAEKLGRIIDSDTAAAANRFNDSLSEVGISVQALGLHIAKAVLPTLEQMAKRMSETASNTDAMREAARAADAGLRLLVTGGTIVTAVFNTLGKVIGAVVASLVAVVEGDYKRALLTMMEAGQDLGKNVGDAVQSVTKTWEGFGEAAQGAAAGVKAAGTAAGQQAPAMRNLAEQARLAAEAAKEANKQLRLAQELARIQAKSAPVPLDVQFDDMEKFWARQAVDARGAAEEIRRAEEAQKRYLELQRAMAPRALDQDFDELEKFWARQAAGLDKVKEKTREVNDFAKSLGLTFSSAFEDAIIKGSSFRDVLKGIEQDIARIIIRQGVSVPAANAIGDLLSKINWGGGTSGAEQLSGPPEERAFGGSVSGGMPYLVGERGPELFVPGMSGTVVPNDALGGSVSIYQTINVDSRSDQASIAMAMQRAKDAAVAEVTARQQRRGDARIG